MAPVQITDIKLNNGHPFWFVENNELDIITIGLCFSGAGAMSDPVNKPGLTGMMASLLLTGGAGDYNRRDFHKKLLAKHISLEAVATDDDLVITLQVPVKFLQEALDLLKLILTRPLFEEEALALEVNQTTALLQQALHTPETMAKEHLFQAIFAKNHPYATSTVKKIEALPGFTRADLQAHFTKIITKERVHATACGKGKSANLAESLNKIIDTLPIAPAQPLVQDGNLENEGKTFFHKMPIPQSVVLFAQPTVNRKDPDFFAAHLLISALGGTSFESRLWHEIREKRGLAYGISLSNFDQALKYALIGYLGTASASVKEAIAIIKSEWQKASETGITQQELDTQKEFITGSYPLLFNRSSDVVRVLLSYISHGLPSTYAAERNAKVNAVTLEDVNRLAKKLLSPNKLTFVVLGLNEN